MTNTAHKEPQAAPELYYIQDKRSYLGNAPMWWAKEGKGYTAYIMGAERFHEDEALKIQAEAPEKYRAFKCSEIDQRLHLVFDAQDIKRLGTSEPCGWASGYAANPFATPQNLPEVPVFYSETAQHLEGLEKGAMAVLANLMMKTNASQAEFMIGNAKDGTFSFKCTHEKPAPEQGGQK